MCLSFVLSAFLGESLLAQQDRETRSVRVTVEDGVRFELVADRVFEAPARGDTLQVQITIQITNGGATPLRFRLLDVLEISMLDSAERLLPMDGGRDGIRPDPPVSEAIKPGATLVIERPAQVFWTSTTNLRLQGDDPFGGIWYIDGLQSGIYHLKVRYHNDDPLGPRDAPVWIGDVHLPPLDVEVKW